MDSTKTKINEIIELFVNEVDADIYILSHATAPFISAASIEKGLLQVIQGNYDSSLSVKKIQEFLWKDKHPFNYELTSIPRTQDLDPYYIETSGFYIFTKSVFLNENRRIGNKPYLVEVSEIESIDIDTYEDFEVADAIYNYKKNIL